MHETNRALPSVDQPLHGPRLAGSLTRRAALAASVLALAAPGQAQTAYPHKLIKIVVPFPPGASPDVVARIWAEHLRAESGQAVIIDNRPGASTMIGAQAARPHPGTATRCCTQWRIRFPSTPMCFRPCPTRPRISRRSAACWPYRT